MIYPGTQDNFLGGAGAGGDDNKKKLVDMLSRRLQAAPLFGGTGRGSSDLPQVGAPNITFNPFLKMLAGRPGETFNDLPEGIDQAIAAGVQQGGGPMQGGGAPGDPNNAGFVGSSVPTTAPSSVSSPNPAATANPYGGRVGGGGVGSHDFGQGTSPMGAPQASAQAGLTSHPFFDTYVPPGGTAPPISAFGNVGGGTTQAGQDPFGLGVSSNNPMYHTLLQMMLLGYDR